MKRVCYGRRQIRILFISLAGVMWCTFATGVVQKPDGVDPKKLQVSPVHLAEAQHSQHKQKDSMSTPPNATLGGSSYKVRDGDHLFLILMRRYGLSNEAAEKLIPEVMRLNGIRKPEELSVGQLLAIPLPPAINNASNTPSQRKRQKLHRAPRTGSTDTAPHVRVIAVSATQPCLIAREVAEQLGVRASSHFPLINTENISVSFNALKIVVVCGLAPAETYTLRRLLAMQGLGLLAFKADERPRRVIEELSDRLGIPARLSNPDTAAEPPLTYFFPTVIAGKGLMLTIRPDDSTTK